MACADLPKAKYALRGKNVLWTLARAVRASTPNLVEIEVEVHECEPHKAQNQKPTLFFAEPKLFFAGVFAVNTADEPGLLRRQWKDLIETLPEYWVRQSLLGSVGLNASMFGFDVWKSPIQTCEHLGVNLPIEIERLRAFVL